MKQFRRILSYILVLVLTVSLLCPAGASNLRQMTVHLQIEGIDNNLFAGAVTVDYVGQPPTVDVFLRAAAHSAALPGITMTDGAYGAYISEIAGIGEGSFGGLDGWLFRINGSSPAHGISAQTLADGDRLVLYYSDEYGVGMQFPYLDISQLASAGTVRVLSDDPVYDEAFQVSLVTRPVAGATLTFDGCDYLTDETGTAVIRQQDCGLGPHSYMVQRCHENGVPTVLRPVPGSEVTFGYRDISDTFLFYDAVDFVLRQGLMRGTDPEHFSPTLYLDRATFVTILWRAAGCPAPAAENAVISFPDVPGDKWYSEAVRWAADAGLVLGYEDGSFRPGAHLSRQQAFTLLWRFAGCPIPETDLSGFPDSGSVSSYAGQAVAWAVSAGLTPKVGTLDPLNRLSRARTAELMMHYAAADTAA